MSQDVRHRNLLYSSNKLEILPIVKLKDKIFDQDLIGFIQLPKTGSTNVIYLMKAIAKEQKFTQLGFSAPYGPRESHITFVEGFLGGLNVIKQNPNKCDCSKNNIKFIYSHMPLPEINYFNKDVNYISLVRNPLDRALSLVNFLYQRKFLEENEIENYILNIEIDNLQTRFLAGEQYMRGKCTEVTFEQAKKNIQDKFALVAPTEEVSTVMAILGGHFGVVNAAIGKSQVTKLKVVSKENVELCDKIKQKDYYDFKLYNFVKENWNIWKEQHIEHISDNKNSSLEYLVISSSFYDKREIHYMNLSAIESLSAVETDLTGVIQTYF